MTHLCECGATLTTCGWNNNVNTILRCEECQAKRKMLLSQINAAIDGSIETIYVSTSLRHLVSVDDFSIEVIFRRAEKMDEDFQVA